MVCKSVFIDTELFEDFEQNFWICTNRKNSLHYQCQPLGVSCIISRTPIHKELRESIFGSFTSCLTAQELLSVNVYSVANLSKLHQLIFPNNEQHHDWYTLALGIQLQRKSSLLETNHRILFRMPHTA